MRGLLGLMLLIGALLPGAVAAQDATPAACNYGDVPSRVVAEKVDGGLLFHGTGDMVTEAFAVPAGDTIIAIDAAGDDPEAYYSIVTHAPNGSAADALPRQPVLTQGAGYRGMAVIATDVAGEIYLEISAPGPWTMKLEF